MYIPHEFNNTQSANCPSEKLNNNIELIKILETRERTIKLLHEIKSRLTEGMNEPEARKLAYATAEEFGVVKHWHIPYIRFGAGTALSFHAPLKEENKLTVDSPFYIDIGPVWADKKTGIEYEGDYGDTFIFGENELVEKCILFTRKIFTEAKSQWIKDALTGEQLYQFIKKKALSNGYKLVEDFDGHRISDFPHNKYTKERLAQTTFTPKKSFWILEIQINDAQNRFGAFFEDIL